MIVVRGSSGTALASGVNYYFESHCNVQLSWTGSTFDVEHLPNPLPAPNRRRRVEKLTPFSYYQNVCTVSYTMVWWDWKRWEQGRCVFCVRFVGLILSVDTACACFWMRGSEIDWMALNGINLPLAFTGQEYVWQQTFAQFGLSPSNLTDFFSGYQSPMPGSGIVACHSL